MQKIHKPLLPEWRYWPAFPLVGLLVLCVTGLSLVVAAHQKPHTLALTENATQANATFQSTRKSADDRIADYTWWLMAFTAILGGTSIFQSYFLIRGDRLTRKSIELARAEFIATHRPRIRVRLISLPDIDNDGRGNIRVVVANVGDSVARIVRYTAWADYYVGRQQPTPFPLNPLNTSEDIILVSGARHVFDHKTEQTWIDPGPSKFLLSGEITYIDDTGRRRHTGFSREFSSDWTSFRVSEAFAEDEYED